MAFPSWFDELIGFVRQSDFIRNLSTVFENEVDRLEDVMDELENARHIDNAARDALDRHAGNVNIARESGEADSSLRQRIILEILILSSEDTIDDVQRAFLPKHYPASSPDWDGQKTEVVEKHNIGLFAHFLLRVDTYFIGNVLSIAEIKDLISRIRPVGVSTELVSEGEFGFADVNGETSDPTIKGFNDGRFSGFVGGGTF